MVKYLLPMNQAVQKKKTKKEMLVIVVALIVYEVSGSDMLLL